MPDPGATSVNTANPVSINGVVYSLANPYGFAEPISASGNNGGLGILSLAGWYGLGNLASKFGATDGDQTTGGQISFGLPNSSNRALGLLATSSTGRTALGARFVNQTATTLNALSVQVTGELWRQSDLHKTLDCYYVIDPSGNAVMPSAPSGLLPGLQVSLPVNPAAIGGVAVDGTSGLNQTNVSILNQPIAAWPPGATLWLVWQMNDPTGKAQGLAIDNLSFSASTQAATLPVPLGFQVTATNLVLSWTGLAGLTYQVEYKDDLGASSWTALGSPMAGNGTVLSFTALTTQPSQRFYRLRVLPN